MIITRTQMPQLYKIRKQKIVFSRSTNNFKILHTIWQRDKFLEEEFVDGICTQGILLYIFNIKKGNNITNKYYTFWMKNVA